MEALAYGPHAHTFVLRAAGQYTYFSLYDPTIESSYTVKVPSLNKIITFSYLSDSDDYFPMKKSLLNSPWAAIVFLVDPSDSNWFENLQNDFGIRENHSDLLEYLVFKDEIQIPAQEDDYKHFIKNFKGIFAFKNEGKEGECGVDDIILSIAQNMNEPDIEPIVPSPKKGFFARLFKRKG